MRKRAKQRAPRPATVAVHVRDGMVEAIYADRLTDVIVIDHDVTGFTFTDPDDPDTPRAVGRDWLQSAGTTADKREVDAARNAAPDDAGGSDDA